MHPPEPTDHASTDSLEGESRGQRFRRWCFRVKAFGVRDGWWWLLDRLEQRSGFRRVFYGTLAALILAVTWGMAIGPWHDRRNALRIARGWIDAGRLVEAAEAAKVALATTPDRPEAWQLAAELARRRRNPLSALIYSSTAAQLAPEDTALVLEWAADGLLADQPDQAQRALATLPAEVLAHSAPAQRLAGEVARREFRLDAARDHFATALQLDGSAAIDEVPLGTILLNARAPAERARGLALLTKWSGDPAWGANVLRALLGDALSRDDRPAMLRWADALRAHPRCTLGDIPNCLLALVRADPVRCATVLAVMEQDHAANSVAIALMLGWLDQIGRPAEAVRWFRSLPPALTQKPPAMVAVAESLRQDAEWAELHDWVAACDWSGDRDFLGTVYDLAAARQLQQDEKADLLWQTLQNQGRANGAHALFAGDTIFTWGWRDNAVTLWWSATAESGTAVAALGTLVRYFEVQHDAEGQYQAYARLYAMRSQDPGIANNFAFFAILTGNNPNAGAKIALENHRRHPDNPVYLSTYAFSLCEQEQAAAALKMLQPVADGWRQSPAVAFAYGLALAGTGRKAEARAVLDSLDGSRRSVREEALIRARSD